MAPRRSSSLSDPNTRGLPASSPAQDNAVAQGGISVTREVTVSVGQEAAFDFVAAEGVLPKVLTGYGLLPAVVATSGNTGPWSKPGSRRVVHLADGKTAREEVTHYDRPGYFAYRVSDPTFALRYLMNEARGEFSFTPVDDRTHIRWTYTFQPRNSLAAIPLALFIRTQWTGYMNVCLDNVARLLSAPQPSADGSFNHIV